MKYVIDRTAQTNAYMQIYEQLRADILAGVIPRGAKLPSKRLLAGELGVSLVTVEHAFALLADEGYVETRERSGCYACFGGAPRREAPLPSPLPSFGTSLLASKFQLYGDRSETEALRVLRTRREAVDGVV